MSINCEKEIIEHDKQLNEMKKNYEAQNINNQQKMDMYISENEELVNTNNDLIVKNKEGNTPLHHAVLIKEKNVDIVRLLVERGRNIYRRKHNGQHQCMDRHDAHPTCSLASRRFILF